MYEQRIAKLVHSTLSGGICNVRWASESRRPGLFEGRGVEAVASGCWRECTRRGGEEERGRRGGGEEGDKARGEGDGERGNEVDRGREEKRGTGGEGCEGEEVEIK